MNEKVYQTGSKGYLFSIVTVAVLGGLLFGYDTAVINGAENGLKAFFIGAQDFQYTDFLHGVTSASALIGCVIGSALSGILASKLGRKYSLIVAGILFFISALGSMMPEFLFFEKGKPTLFLLLSFIFYRVIGGIGVGLASAICPMYIGEVAPSNIRGKLVSCNQFAIIFGMLVVFFVDWLILDKQTEEFIKAILEKNVIPNSDEWTYSGWRYMFGSEAVPAGLFTILICFVPETPRYLVMVKQDQKALSVLSKINGSSKAQQILADIKETITVKTEKLLTYGWMCIFVGVMLSVFQQIVGINAVLYYSKTIFESAGLDDSMKQTVYMGIVNILFTLVAIFTVEKLGRKPLLIWGSIGMAIGAMGVAFSFGHTGLEYVTMISIMVYSASFMYSWGPICWVLIAEIFPNTIRGAAVAIAVAFQWLFNFIVSASFPHMFNMHLTEGDHFGRWFTYGLYGVICVVAAVFVAKLVPETKGKTLEDMTKLWRKQK
jgi:SP family xylose:H+ symportor-like MFS transporter